MGVAIAVAVLFTTVATAAASKPRSRPARAHASSCGWAAGYGPVGWGQWSRSYRSNCWYTTTIVKHPKTYVSWHVLTISSAKACVKAKGFRWRDGKAYWTSLGCGTAGGGYVHWGENWHQVVAYHHVKVKSEGIPLGAPIEFK